MASPSLLESLSNEFASIAENVGGGVVAVHARRWMPFSGIEWKKGVIVTADHGLRREEEIKVVLEGGESVSAAVAGRDASTDLAVLKLAGPGRGAAEVGDAASLRLGHLVLALGRSRRGNLVSSAGMIGGLSGEWRTGRGGKLDQHIRLDLTLYPGFSGGPLVNAQGKVVGINTRGLARGRAVTIPASTVNRVVEELLEKGHIPRPYLGLAMQPVAIPEAMRGKLKSPVASGLLVVHVEPSGPADKAGILLGDVLTDLQGQALDEMGAVMELLGSAKVGDRVAATAIRAGTVTQFTIHLGERPRR
jgi:S1-C subfamily serine protease